MAPVQQSDRGEDKSRWRYGKSVKMRSSWTRRLFSCFLGAGFDRTWVAIWVSPLQRALPCPRVYPVGWDSFPRLEPASAGVLGSGFSPAGFFRAATTAEATTGSPAEAGWEEKPSLWPHHLKVGAKKSLLKQAKSPAVGWWWRERRPQVALEGVTETVTMRCCWFEGRPQERYAAQRTHVAVGCWWFEGSPQERHDAQQINVASRSSWFQGAPQDVHGLGRPAHDLSRGPRTGPQSDYTGGSSCDAAAGR